MSPFVNPQDGSTFLEEDGTTISCEAVAFADEFAFKLKDAMLDVAQEVIDLENRNRIEVSDLKRTLRHAFERAMRK